MSEFLGEARVLIRPDTTAFRTQLVAQLAAATKGVTVPISVTPVAAGGVAGAAAATQALAASSSRAAVTSQQLAGAQLAVATATQQSTAALLGAGSATARLDAGLLGLRTALGSTAVIGLGALALAAIAAGKAIRASLANFAAFEQELSTFRVVAGATAEEMKAVRDQAALLGADVRLPAVSASDAAVAMTELARAGLSVQESLAGAKGVLQLSTAAQIGFADAAQLTANALNSFGLAGEDATRVADDFANAANAAQGSIADIGLALKQSAAVANQVGLSLEDTTAILALFAKNGLQGSDAGTALRTAFLKLINPTKEARAQIELLGLKLRDATGAFRADIFAQFGEATAQFTPKMRDAAAAIIFGTDAIRGAAIGAREGRKALEVMRLEIDKQGTAAETAAARTEGLAGAFAALQSSAQTFSISIGALLSGPLEILASSLTNTFSLLEKLAQGLDRISKIRIAPINIPVSVNGKPVDPDEGFQLQDIIDFTLLGGKGPFGQAKKQLEELNLLIEEGQTPKGILAARKEAERLNEVLQGLQDAAPDLREAGFVAATEILKERIAALKQEIAGLKEEGAGINTSVAGPLLEARDALFAAREAASPTEIPFIDALIKSLNESIPITVQVEGNIQRLRDDFGALGGAARSSATGVDALTKALRDLKVESSALDAELLKLQNENASPQAIILNRQADIAAQNQIIADLKKDGNQPGDATRITAAREKIEADQAEIKRQQDIIASSTKKAADDAAAKSAEIAKNQEDATRAFIEGFGGQKQKILNQIAAAALTDRLSDDIKFQKILVDFLRKQVQAIRDRITKLGLTGDALKAARDAIRTITQEINNILLDIAEDQQAAVERTQDILNQKLDFRIQIAQAQDNVAAEIRARRAKLDLITKELVAAKKAFGKNSVQWLELKAAQAEQIAAIKELENQSKTDGKDAGQSAQQFFFEQLQAQQGFASNLLGNLIPRDQTAGLVGTPSPTTPGGGISIAASVQEGKASGGPSAGQASTTNALLERILQQLKELNGDQKNPEAAYQLRGSHASMDYGAGGGQSAVM